MVDTSHCQEIAANLVNLANGLRSCAQKSRKAVGCNKNIRWSPYRDDSCGQRIHRATQKKPKYGETPHYGMGHGTDYKRSVSVVPEQIQ